ncbi:MAG TPA: hypothetical protein VHX37_01000 [Acidobacteriaceae bacterium]|jgi:uncharacterized protein HemY|nr:hypothetical protein [Acidobacteriaceae bacterium]
MAAISGIVALLVLVGIFWLFRSMGSMGQQPSTGERMKHSAEEQHRQPPRASGLD